MAPGKGQPSALETTEKGISTLLKDGKDERLHSIREALKQRLITTLTEQITEELQDPQPLVDKAFEQIWRDDALFASFKKSLKDRLLDHMMNQLIEEINEEIQEDPERIVNL